MITSFNERYDGTRLEQAGQCYLRYLKMVDKLGTR